MNDVRQRLRAGRMPQAELEHWLRETWQERAGFQRTLYHSAGALKSRPDLGIDLYSDCVTRHLGAGRSALITVRDHAPEHTSYEQLHERCSALGSAWSRGGVAAGDSLAIVLPVGVDYAVALLTGLRLGLVVTPVPPLGPSYVHARIAHVTPDHIVTSERLAHLLPPGSDAPLPLRAAHGDSTASASHTYPPHDIALRLFSPFGEGALSALSELSAANIHADLLRDAMLVFGLQAGDRLSVPGADPLQWQPYALLCAWLAGATWLECDIAQLAAAPRELGATVLGVEAGLRELALVPGSEIGHGVRAWFRNLDDVFDYPHWNALGASFAAREVLGFTVLYNAASGGAQLFSPPTRESAAPCVWPAPGREFVVAQVGAQLLPALDETGVYIPLREGEPDPSLLRAVIAKLDAGWTPGGSIDVGPRSRTLPLAEIAACAERQPGVDAASAVVTPGRWPNSAHVILLVFVADPSTIATFSTNALDAQLRRELGACHVPDRIELFTLHPRRTQHVLDAGWCATQYRSGMLGRKARTPVFQTLSRLGWIFELTR